MPQRQREAHIHHDRQADDLRAAVEILEGVAFRHGRRLRGHPDRLNRNPSDKTGSVHALERRLTAEGIVSKARVARSGPTAGQTSGGQPFSRGALFHLLRNRVFLGEISHRGRHHPGLHPAILDAELFAAVQARLDAQARRRETTRNATVARAALTGRIVDAEGQPMSPTFAYGKGGRLYRYYVSAPLQQGARATPGDDIPRRISAAALEAALTEALAVEPQQVVHR